MQIIKSAEVSKESRPACTITAYPFEKNTVDVAVAKISGRYPATGFCVNEQCDEVAYIFEGNINITKKDDAAKPLNIGDCVFISKGDAFFWEGNGKMVISCSPAWSPEQYKNIED